MMMHMYPYNNLNFNSFEGESSLVQAQGFAFQQQQNWNLYSQLALDPFLSTENFDNINVLSSTDQNFSQYNFQQNFDYFNIKKKSDHIYSKFTIPSITSIISQQSLSNNNPINTMNFLSSLSSNNNNDLFSPSPPSIISSIPSNSNSSIELDFNYNDNQNSIHSSNSLSYFNIPDKDTTISLQDIIDGMKVMQEISKELTSYHNSDLDYNLLHDIMNYLVTDLNENQIDWLIHENLKELSNHVETNESNEILNEKMN
ncbi:hypothetical protein C1645_110121 [Glomus cerebriforme]|uniref:Uncharacterized protein n=1 Tax=Glomus cerebriforme TaxID=658196 RepID=A0A397T645_9GLOM|nr:hypothetical protein C1645_110121 [Glomus cerebriforme]